RIVHVLVVNEYDNDAVHVAHDIQILYHIVYLSLHRLNYDSKQEEDDDHVHVHVHDHDHDHGNDSLGERVIEMSACVAWVVISHPPHVVIVALSFVCVMMITMTATWMNETQDPHQVTQIH